MIKIYKLDFPNYFIFRDSYFTGQKATYYVRSLRIGYDTIGRKVLVYNGHVFRPFLIKDIHVNSMVGAFVHTKIIGSHIHERKKKRKK